MLIPLQLKSRKFTVGKEFQLVFSCYQCLCLSDQMIISTFVCKSVALLRGSLCCISVSLMPRVSSTLYQTKLLLLLCDPYSIPLYTCAVY
jgi:hypothetical protein